MKKQLRDDFGSVKNLMYEVTGVKEGDSGYFVYRNNGDLDNAIADFSLIQLTYNTTSSNMLIVGWVGRGVRIFIAPLENKIWGRYALSDGEWFMYSTVNSAKDIEKLLYMNGYIGVKHKA